MSAPIRIPGRETPPPPRSNYDILNERYHNVVEIGGRVDIGAPEEIKMQNPSKKGYKVDVKLLLNRNSPPLCVGTGEDDKDMKGAYKDLLSKLGVEIPKTLNMDDEKAFRESAFSDINAKYNMVHPSSAKVEESVKDGKATVEVTVRNGSVVVRGIGSTEEKAYARILPS